MEIADKFYRYTDNPRLHDNEVMHSKIPPTIDSLLEVGCGDGEMLDRYSEIEALGLDYNPSMVKYAQECGRNILHENILECSSLIDKYNQWFEVVTANYVFMEFTSCELESAFKNIFQLLKQDGRFYFTITNPLVSGREDLPGYRIQFQEPYSYDSIDVPFTVLLGNSEEGFEDVGIRDYHKPIWVYERALVQAGFKKCKIDELNIGLDYAHALLFTGKK